MAVIIAHIFNCIFLKEEKGGAMFPLAERDIALITYASILDTTKCHRSHVWLVVCCGCATGGAR